MIKKAIIGTGVTLLLGLFFFGGNMVSYVGTSARYMRQAVTDSVPTEFQIEVARDMVTSLGPEIEKNMRAIVREEVEVENLEKRIADTEAKLAGEKEALLRLRSDLATGKEFFVYCGRDYSADQVKLDLANRFDRYKTHESTLESLRHRYDARSGALAAARQQLTELIAHKDQLEAEVESLEAQAEMIAAAEATNAYEFDDSKLGRVRELVSELRTQLDVKARVANAETHYRGRIPLENDTPSNITEQVTKYFQIDTPQPEALAQD